MIASYIYYLPGAVEHCAIRVESDLLVWHCDTMLVGIFLIREEQVRHPDPCGSLTFYGKRGHILVKLLKPETRVMPRLT